MIRRGVANEKAVLYRAGQGGGGGVGVGGWVGSGGELRQGPDPCGVLIHKNIYDRI